jgi:predicted  nucleic acid-binding Zn-ribbon protein
VKQDLREIWVLERRIDELREFIRRLRREITALKNIGRVTIERERELLTFEASVNDLENELSQLREKQAVLQGE